MKKNRLSARLALFVSALALLGACGKKPGPKADAAGPSRTAAAPARPPVDLPPPPVERTLGGIELTPLVDAGPEGENVISHALGLTNDKARSVTGLIRAGTAAKRVVLALLTSKSLDEVTGALEVLGADGDPTGGRSEVVEPLVALLSHEAAVVRDRAWELAPKVIEGDALVDLVRRIEPAKKAAVVRLLELWDSAAIRAALGELARGTDPELAREAAYTLTTASRPVAPETLTLVDELVRAPTTRALGLAVARRVPVESLGAPLKANVSKAIDEALVATDVAVVLAAIRATIVLPFADRLPLLEQLSRDSREDVRRVTTETLGLTTGQKPGPEESARLGKTLDGLLADAEGPVRIAAIRARAHTATPAVAASAAASIGAKLQDGHRGVRIAAAVALSNPLFGEASAKLIEAQLVREDAPAQALILEALAVSKSRPHVALVLARLQEPELQAAAHLALNTASGKDFPANIDAWRPWFEETYPAPSAPPREAVPPSPPFPSE
jgi:hypothetical protein